MAETVIEYRLILGLMSAHVHVLCRQAPLLEKQRSVRSSRSPSRNNFIVRYDPSLLLDNAEDHYRCPQALRADIDWSIDWFQRPRTMTGKDQQRAGW